MNPRIRNPGIGLLALGLLWIVLYWAASPHASPVDEFGEPGAILVQRPGAERTDAQRGGDRGHDRANSGEPAGVPTPPPVGRRGPQDASTADLSGADDAALSDEPRPEAEPEPAPDPEPSHAWYTVRSGDSLSEISQRVYGSARHWRVLYEANRDRIPDPDRLRVGTELRVPPLPDRR